MCKKVKTQKKPNKKLLSLVRRDGTKCHYCGVKTWIEDFSPQQKERLRLMKRRKRARHRLKVATRDHVRPKVRGGTDALANLVIACHNCNTIRGSVPYHLFKFASKHGHGVWVSEKWHHIRSACLFWRTYLRGRKRPRWVRAVVYYLPI